MKVTDKSRLLSATKPAKPPKAPKLKKPARERISGSFRSRLDWHWLCHIIAIRGVRPHDVEDVAQEVLFIASKIPPKPPSFPDQTPKQQRRALLRRLVRFEVWAYFREDHRKPEIPRRDIDELAESPTETEEALELKEQWHVAETSLEELKAKRPELYEVVHAHDFEEEPMPRVALKVSIGEMTAWGRYRMGKPMLLAIAKRHLARMRFNDGEVVSQ